MAPFSELPALPRAYFECYSLRWREYTCSFCYVHTWKATAGRAAAKTTETPLTLSIRKILDRTTSTFIMWHTASFMFRFWRGEVKSDVFIKLLSCTLRGHESYLLFYPSLLHPTLQTNPGGDLLSAQSTFLVLCCFVVSFEFNTLCGCEASCLMWFLKPSYAQ